MIQSVGGMSASFASMPMQASSPEPQQKFDELDVNCDGIVSADELAASIAGAPEIEGMEAPDAEELMSSLDTDGDGALTFSEFEAGRPQGPPPGGPPPGRGGGGGQGGGMDLSQLFAGGEEEESTMQGMYELLC